MASPTSLDLLAFDILLPPIAAAGFYIFATAWLGLLGVSRSQRMIRFRRLGFWMVLIGLYVIVAAIYIDPDLARRLVG